MSRITISVLVLFATSFAFASDASAQLFRRGFRNCARTQCEPCCGWASPGGFEFNDWTPHQSVVGRSCCHSNIICANGCAPLVPVCGTVCPQCLGITEFPVCWTGIDECYKWCEDNNGPLCTPSCKAYCWWAYYGGIKPIILSACKYPTRGIR
jgi:hypothetical protein